MDDTKLEPASDDPHKTPEKALAEYGAINSSDYAPDMLLDSRRGSKWISAYAIAMIYLLVTAGPDSVFSSISPVWRRIEILLFMVALLVQAVFLLWHRACFMGVAMERRGLIVMQLRVPWNPVHLHNTKHQMKAFAKKVELDYADEYITFAMLSDLLAVFVLVFATLLVVVTWW